MHRATAQLTGVAARIARISDPQDNVELSVEYVALIQARTSFEASLAVLRTADEMSRNLVDLIG